MGTKWKSEGQAVGKFLEDRSHDSFRAVVDEYFGLVKKVVFRVVLNEEDTLDITQETFVVAYRKVHQFKGDAKFTIRLPLPSSPSLLCFASLLHPSPLSARRRKPKGGLVNPAPSPPRFLTASPLRPPAFQSITLAI